MNKIIGGLVGLTAALVLVSGTAFALFSDTVTVSGINLNTGTAALLIDPDLDGSELGTDSLDLFAALGNSDVPNLVPGVPQSTQFRLLNQGDVDLALIGRLTGHPIGTNWDLLKSQIQVAVSDINSNPDAGDDTTTGWLTLEQWSSANRNLPNSPIVALTGSEDYWVHIRLKSGADDNLQGLSLDDLTFEITGTQVN